MYFPSYAVVPVFVFAVLLNFFCLYAPTDSLQCGQNFTTCQECLNSTCHTCQNRSCTVNPAAQGANATYQCFTCDPDPINGPQYYSKDECTAGCTNTSKQCVCDGACYMCVESAGLDATKYVCAMPTMQVLDAQCSPVSYNGSTNATNTTSK